MCPVTSEPLLSQVLRVSLSKHKTLELNFTFTQASFLLLDSHITLPLDSPLGCCLGAFLGTLWPEAVGDSLGEGEEGLQQAFLQGGLLHPS